MAEKRRTSARRVGLVGLGAALTLLSCIGAGYAIVCLLLFEPPANPPFAEADLGIAKTLSFTDARASSGRVYPGHAGDPYALELRRDDAARLTSEV